MAKDIIVLAAIAAPTSILAVAAWCYCQRLWWAGVGALAAAVGVVFYRPLRASFGVPGGVDGFALAVEFMIFGGLLAVVHLALVWTMVLLAVERLLERRKAAEGKKT